MTLLDIKNYFILELNKSLSISRHGDFVSKRLLEAMSYALLLPGKRLRPLLVFASALSFNHKAHNKDILKLALPAALAIEYIHTYSLIHDDLPCMDNDDTRKGKPTVHRQYDEALAILAGDALLTDAFLIALNSKYNAVKIAKELALAAGSKNLVAGQAEDLNSDINKPPSWFFINQAKTAKLFMAAAYMGGLAINASKSDLAILYSLSKDLGLAFQMQDDEDDQDVAKKYLSLDALIKDKNKYINNSLMLAQKLYHPQWITDLIYLAFAKDGSGNIIEDKI